MADFRSNYPPLKLLSDDDGDYARIQVETGQTGFFAGREFRTFRRIAISSSSPLVVKAVVPMDLTLDGLDISLVDGWVDLETRVGGTEGGTFSETLPIFNRNNMSTTNGYTSGVTLTAGGTHTGGTVLDVLMARSAGATAKASSVGASLTDQRGIGAGTYYFVMTNPGSGTNNGVFSARWEERP